MTPASKVVKIKPKTGKGSGVRGRPFTKGSDTRRAPGRPAGSKNKVPVAVKAFFQAMVEDPDVQEAFKAQIVGGDRGSMAAFLGAAAHVIGKPKESVEISVPPNMSKLLIMGLTAANEMAAKVGEKKAGKG